MVAWIQYFRYSLHTRHPNKKTPAHQDDKKKEEEPLSVCALVSHCSFGQGCPYPRNFGRFSRVHGRARSVGGLTLAHLVRVIPSLPQLPCIHTSGAASPESIRSIAYGHQGISDSGGISLWASWHELLDILVKACSRRRRQRSSNGGKCHGAAIRHSMNLNQLSGVGNASGKSCKASPSACQTANLTWAFRGQHEPLYLQKCD